ncbi:MAG: sensor histidine kinase [Anaerolineales bacterium]
MLKAIRSHLGLKLFVSYLVVIVVGVAVLATAAELAIPRSFDRHLASMGQIMGDMMSGMSGANLFSSYRAAVTESLLVAALAASVVAVVASIFVSRRVVAPVRSMMAATSRIAEGHYHERLAIAGNLQADEMDELAQLAVSFNQMAAKLDQTEAMRRELIGDVAHELRTPLSTIKGSMEGLIDGVVQPSPEVYHQIYLEADRLQRLVTDLQELSRVEAGAYRLELKTIDLEDLIDGVIARLQGQFDEKGVKLEKELEGPLPQVAVDEDRMGQVLLNLVGNALQFTPPGGRVRIVGERFADRAQIRVEDTGIGIPREYLPRVFTRFYRVEKSRARAGGGSGIGLTIAKHWVEAHGGSLRADSPGADGGSTFTIDLPLSP